MKQVFRTLVLATLVICAFSAVYAEAPSWSYVEAGYLNVDPDDADSAGDNWFAGGNFQIFNNWHVGARYVDGDFGEFEDGLGGTETADFTFWNFVAGWHGLLGENADLFAEATWNDIEVGSDDGEISDDTVGANVGIKWRPVPLFEVDGIVHWADYDNFDSDEDDFASTSYEVKGIFYFGRFGVGAAAEFNDDVTQYSAFARFNFGAK